jgi:hypothetical protein
MILGIRHGQVQAILYLVWFLALVTSGQILFCLVRWHGFRRAEAKINPDSPPPDWWWWVFETLYVILILFSAIIARRVASQLPGLLA